MQRLTHGHERVLVLAELAGARNGDGWLAPKDITDLFDGFQLPPAGNISQDLTRLRKNGLARTRRAKPGWALTPEGHETVAKLIGELDPTAIAAELAATPGAQLGNALHTLIPPVLAPVKWRAPIRQMLDEFDFNTNVFCMTRFPSDDSDTEYLDPVSDVIPAARDALKHHGLTLHLASERQLDPDLYGNIAAHMWACRYGLALFEDRAGRGLNENMIIELGSMLITGRQCALLRDTTIEQMPTDLVGHLYKEVDLTKLTDVAAEIHGWAANDLGLAECPACPAAV